MSSSSPFDALVKRPEFETVPTNQGSIGEIARPLSVWERVTNIEFVRRLFVLVTLGLVWEIYARYIDSPLMFPTISDTLAALWDAATLGQLVNRVFTTVRVLCVGFLAGVALAAVFTTLAVSTRIGADILSTLTSMFNPLPAIALLPLGLLWFGLGEPSLVFVIIHSVLWSVALNTHSGFRSVPETLRMVGANYGLRGLRFVAFILIPAAFPAILTGLRIGWAFGWRTLIAAELIFGVSSGSGGLGWFIFENRNQINTAYVFAGLTTIILIGLFIESVVFRFIEARTIQKWGMQRQ